MKKWVVFSSAWLLFALANCFGGALGEIVGRVRCSEVILDDDGDRLARPVPATGMSMVERKGSLYLFGGTIQYDRTAVRYGHVLWQYDPDERLWERVQQRTGRVAYSIGSTVEVYHDTQWYKGTVESLKNEFGQLQVKIDLLGDLAKDGAGIITPWKDPVDIRFYPPARTLHGALEHNDNMIVFAGHGERGKHTNDVWKYSFGTESWAEMPSVDAPEGREMFSVVRMGGGMVVYGGTKGKGHGMVDLWMYHLKDHVWYPILPDSKAPQPRWGHSAVVYDKKMWVFGGYTANCRNELYVFDWRNKTWMPQRTYGRAPEPRKGHSAVVYDDKMWVFGGHDEKFYNDLFFFDFLTSRWSEVELVGTTQQTKGRKGKGKKKGKGKNAKKAASGPAIIPPRNFHRAHVLGDGQMYVFGGNNENGLLGDFWTIDLSKVLPVGVEE